MELLSGAGAYTPSEATHWVDHLSVPDLSVGTYSIPAGGTDPQSPHTKGSAATRFRNRDELDAASV